MDRATLREVIEDQQSIYDQLSLHYRESFEPLFHHATHPFVVVMAGIRRCGKSSGLHYLRHQMKEKSYVLNFEDDRLIPFTVEDFQTLYELFISLYGEQKTFYFDEIQEIPGWERFIRRLYEKGCKVFITGSNAVMFSKELGTKLTGRYVPLTLYPCSYREFLSFNAPHLLNAAQTTTNKAALYENFMAYTRLGGFPEYIQWQTPEYLHSLFESIVYKDVVARYNIENEQAIKKLAYYLASHISCEISFNKIKGPLGIKSAKTIQDYCAYLTNSYLFFFINRYSHSLKRQYGYHKKVYIIDPAMARNLGFKISRDWGALLENIVFLELLRRYKEVYFHKETRECDFIAKQDHQIVEAIQVTTEINNETTYKRETLGLLEAMRCYELQQGLILTEDHQTEWVEEIEGKKYTILVKPIWRWLIAR